MKKSYTFVLAALAAAPLLASADTPKTDAKTDAKPDAGGHAMYTPGDIKWADAPPVLPAGAKIAVLAGDPFKPGYYSLRLKLPAKYKIAPHTHPIEEYVTVLSGDFSAGMGDKLDAKAVKSFPTGSFMVMPANMAHYVVLAKETTVEISGIGPFAMTYVNPADDPSKAAKK
jgi:hypothetical protein